MSVIKKLLALAAFAALAVTGCLQMEQDITVNADNSVNMKLHYAMSEQAVAQMEAMKKMGEKDPNMKVQVAGPDLAFDEAKLKAQLEQGKPEGVEIKSVKTETKDGWKHAYVELRCKDLSQVAKANGGADDGSLGASGFSLTKNADGNYVLEVATKNRPGADKVPSPEEQAMAKAMMAGLKVAIKVTVPGDIVETTAPVKEGRTASWTLDISDEKFFEKSAEMGKKGMKVVFKGQGLDLKEIKPAARANPAPETKAGE